MTKPLPPGRYTHHIHGPGRLSVLSPFLVHSFTPDGIQQPAIAGPGISSPLVKLTGEEARVVLRSTTALVCSNCGAVTDQLPDDRADCVVCDQPFAPRVQR